jgi:hypothetical protein
MALSVREKLQLQKIVREKQAALEHGGLKVREKLEAQKAMREALEKLLVKVESGAGNELLKSLLKGDFNSLAPLPFIEKLREVVASLEGDIGPIKPGVVNFIEYKISAGELVLESVESDELIDESCEKHEEEPEETENSESEEEDEESKEDSQESAE